MLSISYALYLFQLAIICMSFAEYAVEAFASECEPNPFIVQLSAATTGEGLTAVSCYHR
jgi:peptidoglycan/LPS O-acetylase OafA/YrhL